MAKREPSMQLCCICDEDWATTFLPNGDPACAECAHLLAAYDRHDQPCTRLDSLSLADMARLAGKMSASHYAALAPLRGEALVGPTRGEGE